jgi:hypothetical protein
MDPSDPGRSSMRPQLNHHKWCNDKAPIKLFLLASARHNHPLSFPALAEVTLM